MDASAKKIDIGLMLTCSAESAEVETVFRLASAAAENGYKVSLFLMCNGTTLLTDRRIAELTNAGVEIVYCAHNAAERSVSSPPGVALDGSQYELAEIINNCSKFLSFN